MINTDNNLSCSCMQPWLCSLLTAVFIYCRFANNLVYYGLSFNSSNLGGNIYINFLVAGAVEIPAYVFSILAFEHIGRKIPLIFCLLSSGLSLLAIIAVPKGNWHVKYHWNDLFSMTSPLYHQNSILISRYFCPRCSIAPEQGTL